MADEIINTLGFDVNAALSALRNLDNALQATGAAFGNFGTAIDGFNTRAQAALNAMRGLASAASRLATASQTMGTTAATAPAASPSSTLWLPPGVQSAAQQAASAMAGVGSAAQRAGQQAAAGMNQAANATAGAKKQGDALIVSWNTIARVVMTQAIVRALSMMRNALRDSVTAAEDFQIRLAEIQSVAPRLADSISAIGRATPFKSLEAEVTRFAKMANIPLPQVEEGLYETISDQFTSITDRTNVMNAAMKLAKVGVMEFGTAVTLLTGTLNAYGKSSAEADSLAAKFFTTINLGHVRGKELADTMGQVIPIASELGVTVDELNSAMIAMTIGGMDAHKTVTALRGVMTAFLKPSEDMKRVMRSMGFSDPSQIIAAKGFQGALQAIADAANGMGSEIAKSVRNVRALTAELRLTSDAGAKKYQEALEAMKRSTPEGLEQILKEFRSTDADKFQSQINAIKVNLTQGFGQVMVKLLGDMVAFLGGADKVSAAITALAAAAIPCVAALSLLAAGFALVHLSMGPVGAALVGITALLAMTVGAYTYQTATNVANIKRESEARHEATLKTLRDEQLKIAKWKEAAQVEAQVAQGRWADAAASIRRDYFKALDDLKIKNTETISSARTVMESMVASQERVVSAYRNAANAAAKAVGESQSRVAAVQAQYDDTRFKQIQKRWSVEVQAENFRRRALQEAQRAASQLASARTPDEIQAALAVFQRAEAHAKEAESITAMTGSVGRRRLAEQTVLSVMQQQIDAERQLQRLQADQALKLAQQAAREQGRINVMKMAMAAILKDLDAFDRQGAKEPKALAEQQARLQENLKTFRDQFMAGQKVEVSDLLAFDQLQRRVAVALEGGVSQVDIARFNAIPESFTDLRRQIEEGVGPIKVMIQRATGTDAALASEIKGMSAEEALSHLEKRRTEAGQQLINVGELQRGLAAVRRGLNQFKRDALADLKAWETQTRKGEGVSLKGLTAWSDVSKQPLKEEAQRIQEAARVILEKNRLVTDKDFLAFQAAYEQYKEALKPSAESIAALDEFRDRALEIKEQAESARKIEEGLRQGTDKAAEAAQRLRSIDEAMRAVKEGADRTKTATEAADQSARSATSALNEVSQADMGRLTGQINSAAAAMWDLVVAAKSFTPPDTSAMTAARGGQVDYLAGGGMAARGTDTVPAMLSPGEVVINAKSALRFRSQLLAMNAGATPVFRAQGGETNVTVGDIHINEASQPRETAREVVRAINREIRRGTSRRY